MNQFTSLDGTSSNEQKIAMFHCIVAKELLESKKEGQNNHFAFGNNLSIFPIIGLSSENTNWLNMIYKRS